MTERYIKIQRMTEQILRMTHENHKNAYSYFKEWLTESQE
jgi:hypothetical protein